MSTVKENLIAAKALIADPKKWGKHEYEPGPGRLCAYGALGMAERGIPHAYTVEGADALRAAVPRGFHRSVTRFNDDPYTTHADVMALYDRAIAAQDGE